MNKKEVIKIIWNSLLLGLSAILVIGGIIKLFYQQWIIAIVSIILGLLLIYRGFKR